jgi:hypothetical protein
MPPAGLLTPEESEALAKVKEEEESIACANNMKQLLLAVRAWAKDNGDRNPPDVLSMSNKLGTPKDLLCPGDHAREPAKDWASCTLANCSYEYLAPSVLHSDRETQGVLFRCPIHGHVGLCEGSVQNRLAKKNPEWLVQHGGMLYVDWPRPGGGSAHAQQPGNPPLGGSRPGGSNK